MIPVYNPYNTQNVTLRPQDVTDILSRYGVVGYKPRDLGLFQTAFVHTSYVAKDASAYTTPAGDPAVLAPCPKGCLPLQPDSYQLLECGGDKVLDMVVTDYLMDRYPKTLYPSVSEAFITNLRSKIVRNEMIGEVSFKLGFGRLFVVSRHIDQVMNGRYNRKLLGDIFEAFLGALWKDCRDYGLVQRFIVAIIEAEICLERLIRVEDNHKDAFQRWCQTKYGKPPVYEEVSCQTFEGSSARTYTERVVSPDGRVVFGVGSGPNKKKAQQEACRAALESVQRA